MGDTIMKFVHEKMDAQLLNIEAQLQKVKSDVLEKTERTSRALTTAVDLIQVDLQDLTSSLQEPPTFTSASMQALLDRRLSDTTVAIERKFADMSSVQSELVEISERCNSETAKLARVVEQLGSKVADSSRHTGLTKCLCCRAWSEANCFQRQYCCHSRDSFQRLQRGSENA